MDLTPQMDEALAAPLSTAGSPALVLWLPIPITAHPASHRTTLEPLLAVTLQEC